MTSRSLALTALVIAFGVALLVLVPGLALRAPASMPVPVQGLGHIQRTLRLLETREGPLPRVRVLFYGQSITESDWSAEVAERLRARFPHANLEIENRALGGFASQWLVRSAETDLYPFYPDLVIFHVYGSHLRYQDLMRHIRERTTAEVLIQTDHVTSEEAFDEVRDPQKLQPDGPSFTAFMNHRFLPGLVEPYTLAMCDLREAWKAHLERRGQAPAELLKDGLHLNASGDALMAKLVDSCLRRAPELDPSPAEGWVQAHGVEGLPGSHGVWSLDFTGNRIDLVLEPVESGPIEARIDGRPPCELPGARVFTRALSPQAGKWPVLLGLGAGAPLVVETFTLDVRAQSSGRGGQPRYAFALRGSETGADGEGWSDQRFVSTSNRVVIEPDDWNVAYAFELAKKPLPAHFQVHFSVVEQCRRTWQPTAGDAMREHTVTLAQGIVNGPHRLWLLGDLSSVREVRVYRPPTLPE